MTDNQEERAATGPVALLTDLEDRFLGGLHPILGPAVLLIMRVWISWIFFSAGWQRVKSWDSQAFLFTDIHPVPFLPASISPWLTTAGELALPILCVLGLFGRSSALGLLVMTMVIEFVVAQTPQGIENGIGNSVHYYWMLMTFALVAWGPGKWSVDHLILKRN